MEPQLTIEHIPFIWGIAFTVDIMVGVMTFMLVVRKNIPAYAKGMMTWIGWWSWASALSLVINAIEGANATFSYHQIGVFTETMTNLGIVAWGLAYAFKNWNIQDADWMRMEKLRAEISSENQLKGIENDSK